MDKRVLVVDDDPAARRLLKGHLASAGYRVFLASDGVEALNVLHAEGPRIVISDWMMPRMDGLELCRAIRADDGIGFIYVIMLTAYSDMARVVEAFEAGADDFLSKPFHEQELLARLRAGTRVLRLQSDLVRERRAIHKANAELATLHGRLEWMATTDELTGLGNRREAMRRLNQEWSLAASRHSPLACVILDIDQFKRLNDTYGHDTGDAVLRQTAEVLKDSTRATEQPYRIGGEEFLLLFSSTTVAEAAKAAERLRIAVESGRFRTNGLELTLTVSAGVAGRDHTTKTPDDLLKRADEAMYAAKRGGRNRVCIAGDARASGLLDFEAAPPGRTPAPDSAGDLDDAPIKVLVVDEDDDARKLCRNILQQEGYTVSEACDGLEALGKVGQALPDVIVMDALMPNLDGLQCTRRLKADPVIREIPVIMVSAQTGAEDIEAGLKAGVDEYITKPFRHKEFALRVRSMARLNRSKAELIRSNKVRGEQARAMGILFDLSRRLAAAKTVDSILEHTISMTAELLGCRRISVMLPDRENKNLIIVKAIGIDDELAATVRVPFGCAIAGRVFVTGEPIVVNTSEDATSHGARYDSEFFASIPLVSKALSAAGRVVGVLNITERCGGQPFDPHELAYVDLICNMAASQMDELLSRHARDQALDSLVVGLGTLAEYRDALTGNHLERVTRYTLMLAKELKRTQRYKHIIDGALLYNLELAMPLHDIGKVGVPDAILLKPGRLTDEELAAMRRHAELGAKAIQSVIDRAPDVGFLKLAREIAHAHHERYDGSGYPRGLKGREIPLGARLAAVADVYDALTTERPYKAAFPHQEAVRIIREGSGTQFDPDVVRAFERRAGEFARIMAALRDESPVARGRVTEHSPLHHLAAGKAPCSAPLAACLDPP